MAFGKVTILNDDELARVHETSLRLLEEVGVRVHSRRVRDLLQENGADVNHDDERVRMHPSLVMESLKKAPSEIVLAGRNPEHDLHIPTDRAPYGATTGYVDNMRNLATGEEWTSDADDLRDFARLADSLDQVDYFWPSVFPSDAPKDVRRIHSYAISVRNTTKHIQGEVRSAAEAKWKIELAAAVVGGRDALADRPIFSSVHGSISPLGFEKGVSEGMVELARAGIPVMPFSMAMSGTTGPGTLAGTITVDNAENLAANVILQSASEGAPVIYTAESTPANMTTGMINYSSPEYPLLSAAITQLGRYYDLPTYNPSSCAMDEAPEDAESLFSKVNALALRNLARGDITAGIGGLGSGKSASLEKAVMDAEALAQTEPYLRELVVDEETLAYETIADVGPEGTFLVEEHTVEHFRDEMALDRELTIIPEGSGSFASRAREKAESLLESHEPEPLPDRTEEKLDEILAESEQVLVK